MSDLEDFDIAAFGGRPGFGSPLLSPEDSSNQGFSAMDTSSYGCLLRLSMPQCLVGLGTAGGRGVHGAAQHVIREAGRLPRSVAYVWIDADSADVATDPHHSVVTAVDGSGTNAHNGRESFLEHLDQIRDALLAHTDPLFDADPTLPADKTAREATCFTVVAGPGGTSTGCLDPMISLIWEIARRRSIQEVRIRVLLLGPEMAINDLTRSVADEQAELIRANFAESANRMYELLDSNGEDTHRLNGSSTSHGTRSPRIFSLDIVDQSNGRADFATNDEFIAMVARTLFFQRFTHVGLDFDSRYCDHRGINHHHCQPYARKARRR